MSEFRLVPSRVAFTTNGPAKLRQFMAAVVKKASIQGDEAVLDYWPESIVNSLGGSQCGVTWLPDLGSNQGPAD